MSWNKQIYCQAAQEAFERLLPLFTNETSGVVQTIPPTSIAEILGHIGGGRSDAADTVFTNFFNRLVDSGIPSKDLDQRILAQLHSNIPKAAINAKAVDCPGHDDYLENTQPK